MSQEISSQLNTLSTLVKPQKERQPINSWVIRQTQKALEQYSEQKIACMRQQRELLYEKTKNPKGRRRKNQLKKPTRRSSRINSSQNQLHSNDQLKVKPIHKQEKPYKKENLFQSNNFDEQIKYECLNEKQKSLLRLQQLIDTHINFQSQYRKKVSVSRHELNRYLQSTQFAISSQKYLVQLQKCNKQLYQWQDDRLRCKQLSPEAIKQRLQQTIYKIIASVQCL